MITAINRLFMNPVLRKALVRSRVPLGALAAVGVLGSIDHRLLWYGVGICLVGEAIQLWCFANLDKQGTLAAHGPYGLCRNPMYLGRFAIVLGPLVLLGCWPLLVVYALLYWFYMYNRVRREEATLAGIFGAAYQEYLAGVNRFLPGRPWHGHPVFTWDGRLFRQNHGPANLAGTLAFLAVVVVISLMQWPGPRPWWWPSTPPSWWWLIALP
jgi:protein-S-isoprenylcysteine O-methyltransferase Ste14